MDVREKLVELLQDENNPVWRWFPNNATMAQLADYLINSGVTVQEDCKDCAEATQNCIVKLQEQISELRSAQEWYYASNPPKEDGTYLVQTNTGTITTARFYSFKSFPATKYTPAVHRPASWQSNRNVVKWTFLPQPPKGE